MIWIIVIGIVVLLIIVGAYNQKKRQEWKDNYYKFLVEKFGGETMNSIVKSEPWLGQTDAEFLAMYGHPNHIEKIGMKTKTKLVLSFKTINPSTKRETRNKYTFENNVLSKIETKGPMTKIWEESKQVNPFENLLL